MSKWQCLTEYNTRSSEWVGPDAPALATPDSLAINATQNPRINGTNKTIPLPYDSPSRSRQGAASGRRSAATTNQLMCSASTSSEYRFDRWFRALLCILLCLLLFFSGQRVRGWLNGRGVSHAYECVTKRKNIEKNRNKKRSQIFN